ncbi:MAG TPA: tryptophan synthase subunit alpha [Gemmatimonadaceae bacterium]|nr:tryptophan synthase subunit alpha [Gemmatimonadaceae bacterium]
MTTSSESRSAPPPRGAAASPPSLPSLRASAAPSTPGEHRAPAEFLTRRFEELRSAGRRALVVYITAGFPDREQSLELLCRIADAGADVIEMGIPFSEPLADGPVIQRSTERALAQGVTLDDAMELVQRASVPVPVVLFTYLNPLLAAGGDVLQRAARAGMHGVLVTDLPVGADPEREAWLGEGPLAFVRLVAPTTPQARMAEIARHGSGFVYLISRLGVTGERPALDPALPGTIERLRAVTSLPVCVGFGIARPEQAAAVSRVADGVAVGSAVVRASEQSVSAAADLVRAMRQAMDAERSAVR